MAQERERGEDRVTGLVVGGLGGAALATVIATLLAARPVQAAPLDEKLDYLIEVLTTLVPVLAEVSERQVALLETLEELLGRPAEERLVVTTRTPWIARPAEQIYEAAIRSSGTFYSDYMVNWTEGKRILFKAESSLNQAVIIQVIGNISDDMKLATDINAGLPLAANGNLSVGLAWDDWHPYVGIKITVPVAPTAGILTISAIIQE